MLGAIIGDIVGSRFEFNNHKSTDFEFFHPDCFVTDDSIMTLAIARACLEAEFAIERNQEYADAMAEFCSVLSEKTVEHMRLLGRQYPNCGYGGRFNSWLRSENPIPYNSFGNGAAMRVSPIAYLARSDSEIDRLVAAVTEVTHNHDEGIRGAEAVARAIFMARAGESKTAIQDVINEDYYQIAFTLDEIRDSYQFNETCQETVPQALQCFFEATSFETAIRLAISLGGDSDTIAAITGSIAEAYFGIPLWMRDKALDYLDPYAREIYDEWDSRYEFDRSQYRTITKHLGVFEHHLVTGSNDKLFDVDLGGFDGQGGVPIVDDELMGGVAAQFSQELNELLESNSGLLETVNQEMDRFPGMSEPIWNDKGYTVEDMGAAQVLAFIILVMRWDFQQTGSKLSFGRLPEFIAALRHLKTIDDQPSYALVHQVRLRIGGYGGFYTYNLSFNSFQAVLTVTNIMADTSKIVRYSRSQTNEVLAMFEALNHRFWLSEYWELGPIFICDGTQWELQVDYHNRPSCVFVGDNAFPPRWDLLEAMLGTDERYMLIGQGYSLRDIYLSSCAEEDDGDDVGNDDGARDGADDNTIIYCSVSFRGQEKTYYYRSEHEGVKVGDEVIVEVGHNKKLQAAIVRKVERFAVDRVPFPVDQTKPILVAARFE